MQVKIGMNKSLFLFLFFVLHTCEICAQELTVKSFKLAENDISAQTQSRRDLNDRNCALVKAAEASYSKLSPNNGDICRLWGGETGE